MRKILLLSMVSMLLLVVVLSACGINFAGKATEFGNLTNGTTTNATTCTNNCSTLGQTTCSGNYVKTCGDYDGNSCLEWNTGTYCSNGCSAGACLAAPAANATNTTNTTTSTTICTDSDSGLNYNVKGTVTVSNGTTFSDFCSGVYNLKEYVCNGTEVNNDWSMYRCPSGYNCTNGACTVNATTSNATVTNITGTGSIYATSIPTGAYVYVDKVNKGITPKTITKVTAGSHKVKFTKSGYISIEKTVAVTADQTTNVSVTLTRTKY
ncbi:MAG TPA: PEGA domain-containing protein [Candidatus Nanoarchaeia archaeon]|nr:PEGA domain-containing protein [Candidatus Nanoarchaeia archaeon]